MARDDAFGFSLPDFAEITLGTSPAFCQQAVPSTAAADRVPDEHAAFLGPDSFQCRDATTENHIKPAK